MKNKIKVQWNLEYSKFVICTLNVVLNQCKKFVVNSKLTFFNSKFLYQSKVSLDAGILRVRFRLHLFIVKKSSEFYFC